MVYKIVYFVRDTEVGNGLWDGADPESYALVGIIRHKATHAVVLDSAGNEVAIVHAKKR